MRVIKVWILCQKTPDETQKDKEEINARRKIARQQMPQQDHEMTKAKNAARHRDVRQQQTEE